MLNFQRVLKRKKYWKYVATPELKRYFAGTSKTVADALYLYRLDNSREVFAF